MEACWIYAAVSSIKQEGTVDDQLAWGRNVAQQHGWRATREFSGVATGKDGTREILEELLRALQSTPRNDRPKRILMVRLDRMGRGTGLDVIGTFGAIYKLGVKIHTRTDGDIPLDSVADAFRPILELMGGAFDNRARSEKSLAMHARKKAAGEPAGLPPYGFVIIDKRLVPHEPEAGFIRDLFHLRMDGWGYARLSRYIAPRAPAKTLPNGKRALQWSPASIATILQNKAYRGKLVGEDTFDAVQRLRRSEPAIPRKARNPWPLAGALRCTCGLRTTVRLSGPIGYRTRYYLCVNITKHGAYRSHRADTIEAQFVAVMARLQAHPELLLSYAPPPDALDEIQERVNTLRGERRALDDRKARIWRLAEEGGLSGAQLKERLDEIEAHAVRLDSAISEGAYILLSAKDESALRKNATSLLNSLIGVWNEVDVTTQQQIARAVSEAVGGLWVDPENRSQLLIGIDRAASEKKAEAFRSFTAIEHVLRSASRDSLARIPDGVLSGGA